MSHTITITRLPGEDRDDAEYTIGGSCDSWCTVWRECEKKHPMATDDELASGEATWHGEEHMAILDLGWCVRTAECGEQYAYDLALDAAEAKETGTYPLEISWDGDMWLALIDFEQRTPLTEPGGSGS